MASGTIKFMSKDKGYGFIVPDDGGADVFVHVSATKTAGPGNIVEGIRVSFDLVPGKEGKGPKAVNVALLAKGIAS